ncbi:MAG: response regulator [Bacteroidetes bacterium]|nr:response regulator [Bacteroidota bacterium]
MAFSTIIVEDSDIYRKVLEEIVRSNKDLDLIASTGDFEEAKVILETMIPDLILLDIEIGSMTSFDLIPFINPQCRIVFVTSHPDYAVKAFEISAVDYLVKPVTMERLNQAINRFKITLEGGNKDAGVSEEKFSMDQRVMVADDDRYTLIEVARIMYIEALGNYVQLFTGPETRLVTYGSIKNWVNRLPAKHFFQIHRSTIINLEFLERIEKYTNDTGRAYLKGKTEPLEISRNYFSLMKKTFKV